MDVVVIAIVDCRDPMSRQLDSAQQAGEGIALRLLGIDHGVQFKRRDDAHHGSTGDLWVIRFRGPRVELHDQVAGEFAVVVDGRVSLGVASFG